MSSSPVFLATQRDIDPAIKLRFEEAQALLSQCPTGRYLLGEAKKSGYVLTPVSSLHDRNFRGQAQPFPKRIRLAAALAPEIMVLTLAHECAHALQFRAGLGGDPQVRFPDATRLLLASEADAHAHMAQVAAELKMMGNGKPFSAFAPEFPLMATIADYLLKAEPEALDSGKLMAEAFKTFYQMPSVRLSYESHQIAVCETAVANPGLGGAFARSLYFVRKVSGDVICDKLAQHQGRPYLRRHAPDVDFSTPLYCGVSAMAKSRLVSLLEKMGRAKEAKNALNEIPVLDQMTTAEESFRRWRLGRDKKKGPG